MTRKYLFPIFCSLSLFFPQCGFSFSETELDSLSATGKKHYSLNPWRTEISFVLQRNVLLNSYLSDDEGKDLRKLTGYELPDNEYSNNLFAPNESASLLDFTNLYYTLNFNFNFTLAEIVKNSKFDFLKNVEFFLNSSFQTPFSGYKNTEEHYSVWKYIHYGLGNITGGLTTPIYQKGILLSDFSFSLIAPLSLFSKEAGFSGGIAGTISFLYFLKKRSKWSLATSSSHNLSYSHYTKKSTNTHGNIKNIPWHTNQIGSFIYQQVFNKYLPTNTSFSATHFFGIDTVQIQKQDLSFSGSVSWKIRERFYLKLSIHWKDRFDVYDPINKKRKTIKPPGWRDLNRYIFALGSSYSF